MTQFQEPAAAGSTAVRAFNKLNVYATFRSAQSGGA